MTGESLINASLDNMTRRVAQGTASGIDSSFRPGLLEVFAVLLALYAIHYFYQKSIARRKY